MMTKLSSKRLLDLVQESDIIDLCRDLLRFKSINPPGNEGEIARYIASILESSGLSIEIMPHTNTRSSLISRLKGTGDLPPLLYCGHLDVVPIGAQKWLHNPFEGRVTESRLWGRGAADMKGGIAAMIIAAKILADSQYVLRGDLILAFTAGEEGEKLGSSSMASRKDLVTVQAVIIPEPSMNEVYVAERGAFWLEITTLGKTAHGSMPQYGDNAIMMMVSLLRELDTLKHNSITHPLLGGFTRSINTIRGGVKTNVVPDQCVVTIDQRTVPGQDRGFILQQVENVINDLKGQIPGFRATVNTIYESVPVATPPDEPIVEIFCEVVTEVTGDRPLPTGAPYCTDAGVLVPALNIPHIICGPGDPKLAHQPDEYVEIQRLIESTKILLLAAITILS